ncbi:NAD-glutamate dehydrogenase domain-containing protein [Trichloromonas sp.]|uniref:NAD-glutamate dehydrogenase domain-containing protein n=1 Tax=Trichloromonas sp. TaxID=3069249 RepID=UPI003D814D2B
MMLIEPHASSLSRNDLEHQFAAARKILEQGEVAEKNRRALSLAAILQEHTHPSYLQPLSPKKLAAWVWTLLDFIETRGSGVGVTLLPFMARHALLVTNVPDVPYLVDSLRACLSSQQRRYYMVCHPMFKVVRQKGAVADLGPIEAGAPTESLIIMEVDADAESAAGLIESVRQAFTAALRIERDRAALQERLESVQSLAEQGGYADFWHWLKDGNFLPFACRRHRVQVGSGGAVKISEAQDEACGISIAEQPQEQLRQRLLRERDVVVELTTMVSPVLRAEPLVCVGFRRMIAEGEWEEHEFFGLFTEKMFDEPAIHVPALRYRIEAALDSLGIPRDSHDYRKTVEIFNTFPKVELFFLKPAELLDAVRSLARIYRDAAVRVVVTSSLAVRGVTLLLVMPRSFYSPGVMPRIEAYLCRYFGAPRAESKIIHISSDYSSHHVSLTPASDQVRVDLGRLERSLTRTARPWDIRLQDLLDQAFGEKEGLALWRRYGAGFSRNYRTLVHPRFALRDVRQIEKVLADGSEIFDLWGPFSGHEQYYRLQFYSPRRSYLNELMPLLENLNLTVIEEVDFGLQLTGAAVYIKSFGIRCCAGGRDLSAQRDNLLSALDALRRGASENDYLNRLLIPTGLSWRQVDIFRGYRNYYFQLGSPYTKKRVAFALINNPQVTLLLYRYFEGRFSDRPEWRDPLAREEQVLSPLRMEIVAALKDVADVNEDNILRTLFNLIDSTVRTNFFIRCDRPDYFFSFKISAIGIIDMPAPRPLYEIYVHSATMEGIHLRGGKVARGGLRWSDRPDDFRTEVLGLMKTQMTKNALIVPVGSKGGFVVKTPYSGREEGMALSKAAYQTLISGLLDLTDNRVGDQVVRPQGVIAYDEEDPYLVVAADKGTAHLPDTANAVSQSYGFWLDDAFASGGSQGYDHKKLGITARGAWECVKRHFRELGSDIQTQPFTVVGIGDMSGDVFGNGMLLSDQTRLLAAFDHRHIFLDPSPDPEKSFAERQRLYDLPRSSWDDYDRSLVSEGGGVYARSAKEIPLSPQVRSWLGVRHESIDPPGLIRLLLTAEVDLLWNGGIGTYFKASTEKNEEAGDRANDGVRVDARQLRAKVAGEGGNLGFTQRGRIEYALAGGRINTDAVDNSAGVDCSDHEVNLKIFMQYLRQQGQVASQEERNRQLEAVTDEVCQAVLANNYGQSLCLSLDQARCLRAVESFIDLSDRLSRAGLMDRRGEFLPSAKEVLAREVRSYVRPELAILMAYSKMQIFQALLASQLPEQAGVRDYLDGYFPEAISTRYRDFLCGHPLAREITATVITNTVIDRAGSAFFNGLVQKHGLALVDAITVWLAFDRVVDGEKLRRQIHAQDNRMPTERQRELLLSIEDALAALCDWAIGDGMKVLPEPKLVSELREKLQAFEKVLGSILPAEQWSLCKACARDCEEGGIAAESARRLSILPHLGDFLPIIVLAEETGSDLYAAARAFIDVRQLLGLDEVLTLARNVPLRDGWDRQALLALTASLADCGFRLTRIVLEQYSGNPDACLSGRRRELNNYRRLRDSLRATTPVNFHPLMILSASLENLVP